MKKFISFLFIASLVLSLSLTAFAAGTSPSSADLDAIHADIKYPNYSWMYLPDYMSARVTHKSVYCFKDPDHDVWRSGNYFTVSYGTEVTILAVGENYGCVIINSTKKAGWINLEYLEAISSPNPRPDTASKLSNGNYYGNIIDIETSSGGWYLTMDVLSYSLFSDRYVSMLILGDWISYGDEVYQVTGFLDEYVLLGNFYLWHLPSGDWVLCDQGGGYVMYKTGSAKLFLSSGARIVDNSISDNKSVSSPWSIYGFGIVSFTVKNNQITYLEREYHP